MKNTVENIKIALVAFVMRQLINLTGFTCRKKIVAGKEILEAVLAEEKQVIYAFWHNRIFFMSYFLKRHILKPGSRGRDLTALISQSRDGELIARVVEAWGMRTARGSSSKGGIEALKALIKILKQSGGSVITTPDGPRGPLYELKPGTTTLARSSGVPVVPIAFAARRAWVMRSWDSFIIPKPFTAIHVSIGEPFVFERNLDEAAMEQKRLQLENYMKEQVAALELSWADREA